MLLLERVRREGVVDAADPGHTPEATFDYFASQIFDPAPAETRELLTAVALFPRVSVELAEAISGNPNAGKILENLFRRHLFVDRRPGDTPAYQFHALFQAFLQNRAVRYLGPSRINDLKLQAAELLCQRGMEEEALPLYVQIGQWGPVVELLIRAAPGLIAQGRWQTLAE
jgi:LuxR family maltose regulon positive regulatory protein